MPFTLVHGLLAYFLVCPFTKDWRLRLLAFAAGMLPDLDGLSIMFGGEAYMQLHRELFHPLIFGLLLAIAAAVILHKYFGMQMTASFLVFSASFILHSIVDVLFTDWPIRLLWPLSLHRFSWPVLVDVEWELALTLIVFAAFTLKIFFLWDWQKFI